MRSPRLSSIRYPRGICRAFSLVAGLSIVDVAYSTSCRPGLASIHPICRFKGFFTACLSKVRSAQGNRLTRRSRQERSKRRSPTSDWSPSQKTCDSLSSKRPPSQTARHRSRRSTSTETAPTQPSPRSTPTRPASRVAHKSWLWASRAVQTRSEASSTTNSCGHASRTPVTSSKSTIWATRRPPCSSTWASTSTKPTYTPQKIRRFLGGHRGEPPQVPRVCSHQLQGVP
jgi:hypothetical protein